MNTNKELPQYKKSRKTGDIGKYNFSATFTRFGTVDSPDPDMGIDFECTLDEDEYVTGMSFYVQLKSTEKEINENKSSFFSEQIEVTTINYWLTKPIPVFLFVYHLPSKTFFWCYPQDQFPEGTLESKLQSNDNISIRVDISTRFSRDIEEIPPDLLQAIKDKGFREKLSNLQKKHEELLEDNTLDYKEQLEYEKYGREEEYLADIMLEDWKIERHNQQ